MEIGRLVAINVTPSSFAELSQIFYIYQPLREGGQRLALHIFKLLIS
jgi:hypothetical protein